MTKFYSSKSNAVRAFRQKFPDIAEPLTSEGIVDAGYVDEDAPGQWVVNDPAVIAQQEADDFEAGMAEELAARGAAAAAEDAAIEANHPFVRTEPAAPAALVVHHTELPKSGKDGCCPHCGTGTANGLYVTEFSEMSPGSQRDTTQQFTCNECAGEWGPVVDKPKPARAPSGTSNGLKIEANRETRNGVTRPSIGGKCRAVWDMLDGIGLNATAKEAREAAAQRGYDKTTTMVQFYRWRKFNGVAGR